MPAECRRIRGPSPLWPAFRKSPAPTRPCSYVATSSRLVETIQASSVAHIRTSREQPVCHGVASESQSRCIAEKERRGVAWARTRSRPQGQEPASGVAAGASCLHRFAGFFCGFFLTTSKNSWRWSLPFPPAEKPERKHFLEPRPGGLDGLADQLSRSFNLCVVWVCWKEPIVL